MSNQKRILKSLTPPAVPLWGIFYSEYEPDFLEKLPVVTLALVELETGGEVHPLVFSQEYGVDIFWWEDSNALGFLTAEELPRATEIFAEEIADRQKEKQKSTKK